MSKTDLFIELAHPDANGKSRWVNTNEFVGKYADLRLGNGFSWGRKSSPLCKRYLVEVCRNLTNGNAIDAIRLNRYNSEASFNQFIRADIRQTILQRRCVMLGIRGTSENTTIEVDHKDGRKNNPRVANPDTQTLDDFQPLCKAANDINRQICRHCRESDIRWDARNIEGNPYPFYQGDEHYTEPLGCIGCYQYDPVEYRIQCSIRISQETADYILHKLYPSYEKKNSSKHTINTPVSQQKKPNTDLVNWADISPYWHCPPASTMTFVDLFCGAGGLSKGLEMAGLLGICGLDWFKEAGLTYNRNFHHPFVYGDIRLSETKQTFYATVQEQLNGRHLHLVAGGFPCQGFSMAGNRIADDPRNSLYKELVDIVSVLQPDWVVCENVKGLRSMLHGKVEEKILADFKAIGYHMNVTTLCAADYYTPQKRERVIFIGNRIAAINYHPLPMLTPEQYITTGQAIADLIHHPCDEDFNHVPTTHSAEMARRMAALPEGESLYKGYSDAWKKCPWNEASCTIKENHGGVNIHPKLPRVLTAREMARLQSFPDDFIFEGKKNKQLVQIGNAVPCLLGKTIGLAKRYGAGDLPLHQ